MLSSCWVYFCGTPGIHTYTPTRIFYRVNATMEFFSIKFKWKLTLLQWPTTWIFSYCAFWKTMFNLISMKTLNTWTVLTSSKRHFKELTILKVFETYSPESSATGMGQFPICKLKRDLFRTSVTAFTIDKNTFSALFGIFYARMDIWKEIFQKRSYTKP